MATAIALLTDARNLAVAENLRDAQAAARRQGLQLPASSDFTEQTISPLVGPPAAMQRKVNENEAPWIYESDRLAWACDLGYVGL